MLKGSDLVNPGRVVGEGVGERVTLVSRKRYGKPLLLSLLLPYRVPYTYSLIKTPPGYNLILQHLCPWPSHCSRDTFNFNPTVNLPPLQTPHYSLPPFLFTSYRFILVPNEPVLNKLILCRLSSLLYKYKQISW